MLLSSLGCLLEADLGFFTDSLQLRDRFTFLFQDPGGLLDVFKTCVVLVTQLTELSSAEEKL